MPKGYPKSGVNEGWFSKGHKPEFTKERNKKISEALKGRKLSDETRNKISVSKKNSKASQIATAKLNASKKGVPLSEEHKRKIGLAGIGRIKSPETLAKMSKALKGRTFSPETIKKMSEARMGKPSNTAGERNWNWKGGITPMKKLLWFSIPYKEWRTSIFERDDFTCQKCGKRGVYLEADHIKPLAMIIFEHQIITKEEAFGCTELWNIDNGQTLCKKCHAEKTSDDMKIMRNQTEIWPETREQFP